MSPARSGDDPLRVLLVEDDADHAALALDSLAGQPVPPAVHHVRDGAQALDYLLRRGAFADPGTSPRPDLMLLDLRLPKVDGLEVLRRVRGRSDLRRLPVVVLTSSPSEEDRKRALGLAADAYLVKPMSEGVLGRVLGSIRPGPRARPEQSS